MAIYQSRGFEFGLTGVLSISGAVLFWGNIALAQITPDATLGAESSLITPNTNIKGIPADRIDGGAVRGTSLFHSFQDFNVGNGQRVYFASPTGIENILSRVTGNNLSNILGTLGVDGGANLFLLNPNGIIFGANARLDIAGSFVASTANSVVFNNGYQFSAKNSDTPPLLTVNVPLGVQYGTNQPKATITNFGNLAVGQNLTLDAGNLDLQGQLQAGGNLILQAQDTVKVRDSAIAPFVASAENQLLVQGNQTVDIFALNHPNSGFYSGGDMVLRSPNSVIGDAYYSTKGNFRIEQPNGTLGNLHSPIDPIIRASGDVSFNDYTGGSLHIFAGGSVTIAGTITINGTDTTNFINQTDPPVPLSQTLPDGTSSVRVNGSLQPTLDIRAGTTAFGTPPFGCVGCPQLLPPMGPILQPTNLRLTNTPPDPPPTRADITINGGINITQPNGLVLLTNQYQPNSLPGNIQVRIIRTDDAFGRFLGSSSSVIIDSRGDIQISRNGLIRTSSATDNAGNISLIANGSFFVTNGGLSTRTEGLGNAGNVNIKVRGAVSLADSSFILTFAGANTGGNGGDINIQSSSLSLTNGSQLQAYVDQGGQGKAGNVNLNILETVILSGINSQGFPSGIFSSVDSGTIGNAGNITVQAGSLFLSDAAQLQAGTIGRGNAGAINVGVANSVVLANGASIESSANSGSTGNGSKIEITAKTVDITGGAQVLTGSSGTGKAGDLAITTTDSTNVNTRGLISTSSTGAGNSGNLSIITGRLNISDAGSVIGTNSLGTGNAGTLLINATDTVTVSNQGLLTTGSLARGNSGNLSIRARRLDVINSGINGGISTAAVGTGNSGNLLVIAPDSINVLGSSNIGTFAAQGIAGSIYLETGQLSIRDNSLVTSSTLGAGDAGELTVSATNSIEVVNNSKLSANTFGRGNGGNLLLVTGKLSVQNGGEVSTLVTSGSSGNAGTLRILAPNLVEVDSAKIATETYGSGNGGTLTLETGTLSVRNRGEVSTGVFETSSGQAGKLSVTASDAVELNGGSLTTLTAGRGAAGNLDINTRKLTAQNGGRVEARTAGFAPGGIVTVNASESIELIGNSGSGTTQTAAISAFSDRNSLGGAPSGNVNITTGDLTIRDGAEVTTVTLGPGEGGNIQVRANSLSLRNGGSITSRSEGKGNAGDINLNLTGDLRSRNGIISATSTQSGGGDINIAADFIRLEDSSLISSSVFDSTGGGGNITINSQVFFARQDSDILANAEAGPGGDITINSPVFLTGLFVRGEAVAVGRNPGNLSRFRGNNRNDISVPFQRSSQNDSSLADSFRDNDQVDISTASRTGNNGTFTANYQPEPQGLAPLPLNIVNAAELIDRRCTPDPDKRGSSFTVTGRGGLPPSPNDPLTNDAVWVDWVTLPDREPKRKDTATNTKPTPSHPIPLVEAQGWEIGADGKVILTASASRVTPGSSGLPLPLCDGVQRNNESN